MLVTVVDVETTGTSDKDQVVEIATVSLEVLTYQIGDQVRQIPRLLETWSSLVRPSVPVSPGARATHHLTDAELVEAPTPDDFDLIEGMSSFRRSDVLVGHNLDFDVRLIKQTFAPNSTLVAPARRVCTWRCARHLYPEQDSHSNQALRYALGLELPPQELPPHRALPDALITALLLSHMLGSRTIEDLERLTTTPVLLSKCPVGKFRGQPWESVDAGMLRWILGREFSEDVMHTARHHLRLRGGNGGT